MSGQAGAGKIRMEEMRAYLNTRYASFTRELFLHRRDLWPALVLNRLARTRDFAGPEIARRHEEKLARIHTAVALGTPDRVPLVTSGLSFYPAHYAGISTSDYCNNRKKFASAYLKFVRENPEFDAVFPSQICFQGPMMRITGLDILALPGVHLPDNVSYQFVEKERLLASEYGAFLEQGWDFFRRVVVPRMTPKYHPKKGWGKKRLAGIVAENLKYAAFYVKMIDIVEKEYGMPVDTGALFFAPFDLVSILLRGLKGISGDLFRHPEQVEAVCEMMGRVVLRYYEAVVAGTGLRGAVVLCERAFSLSPRQFSRFYLPGLKKLCEDLVAMGVLPVIALEGNATHLLEYFLELPPGKCMLNLDTSDIFKAKKILGGHLCLAGNVPMNMLAAGTPDQVRQTCEKLIQELAPGGGYIMSGALGIPDNARHENVRAMVEVTLEKGRY